MIKLRKSLELELELELELNNSHRVFNNNCILSAHLV